MKPESELRQLDRRVCETEDDIEEMQKQLEAIQALLNHVASIVDAMIEGMYI
jgi:hypothetical protein